MNKLFNLFLVGVLCLGLTACGESNSSEVEELKARIEILEQKLEKVEATTITTEELRTEWADSVGKFIGDVSKAEVVGNYIIMADSRGNKYCIRYDLINGTLYFAAGEAGYFFTK